MSSVGRDEPLRASFGFRVNVDEHVREHAAPDGIGGMLCRCAAHELLDFVHPSLLAAEGEQLEPVRDGCVPAHRAVAEVKASP